MANQIKQSHDIGPVESTNEMMMKVLQFRNQKLAELYKQSRNALQNHREEMEKLQNTSAESAIIIKSMNCYWSQFDEHIKLLLQRYGVDADIDKIEKDVLNKGPLIFWKELCNPDHKDLNESLVNRARITSCALMKLLQVVDGIIERNAELEKAISNIPTEFVSENFKKLISTFAEYNQNMLNSNTILYDKFNDMSAQVKIYEETIHVKEEEHLQLKNQINELQQNLDKMYSENEKNQESFAENLERLNKMEVALKETAQTNQNKTPAIEISTNTQKYELIAESRLKELDELHKKYCKALEKLENYKIMVHQLPKAVVEGTTEYKCLNSHYNILRTDWKKLRLNFNTLMNTVQEIKNHHLKQIKEMEEEEKTAHNAFLKQTIRNEQALADWRKEYTDIYSKYECLLTEYEQIKVHNEQMDERLVLVNVRNTDLCLQMQRYKRKCEIITTDYVKLRKMLNQTQLSDASSETDSEKSVSDHFKGSNEEEALLKEVDVTGEAYDNVLDQNSCLMQQILEKNEIHLKLMSHYQITAQACTLLREEKKASEDLVVMLKKQIDAMNILLNKNAEKEQIMEDILSEKEHKLLLCQNLMEGHKQEAQSSTQKAAELQQFVDKYLSRLNETRELLVEKTCAYEKEVYNSKRLQEKLHIFEQQAKRMKLCDNDTNYMDRISLEQLRGYKETLTCPSCKTKPKNAILSKCFHVFCYECLHARYISRERRCPKCNVTFSGNDYHRIYLT